MHYKKHKQFRLPGFNYSAPGHYFITVCTKDRIHYFGEIIKSQNNTTIQLSPIGLFVRDSILSISETYKNTSVGETVVMPNHVHLIITISATSAVATTEQSEMQKMLSPNKGLAPLVPGSVSSITNHLKGKVKKWCKANELGEFDWQSRFYDHIIRNSIEYDRISNYIANNIRNWHDDENNGDSKNFRKDIRS